MEEVTEEGAADRESRALRVVWARRRGRAGARGGGGGVGRGGARGGPKRVPRLRAPVELPLPAWTSWADECEAEAEAEAAAVAEAAGVVDSAPAPAPAAAAPPEEGGPSSSFLATSPPTSPQGVAPAPAPKSGVCVLDEPGRAGAAAAASRSRRS